MRIKILGSSPTCISTHTTHIQLLIGEIGRLAADNSDIDALALLGLLFKIISFDMGLAIDAYMQADQRHIHHRIDQLFTISQAALVLNSTSSLENKLEVIMSNGIRIAGGDASCIAFYDSEKKLFTHWTTEGLSNHFISRMSFQPGGLADHVILRNAHILSNDRPDTEHKLSCLTRREGIKSFIYIPLVFQERPLGVMYVYNKHTDAFNNDQITLLTTFSNLAAGAIAIAQLLEETERLATVDGLTGLTNRRKYDELFDAELKRATRYQRHLSLLLLDIDHFKKINDTYGHPIGDQALQHVSSIISEELRNVDIAARHGGDEFTLLLPETGTEGARLVAERIRTVIESSPLAIDNSQNISITISIGIASYPDCGNTTQQLTRNADQALYEAKGAGRNRVCIYQDIA